MAFAEHIAGGWKRKLQLWTWIHKVIADSLLTWTCFGLVVDPCPVDTSVSPASYLLNFRGTVQVSSQLTWALLFWNAHAILSHSLIASTTAFLDCNYVRALVKVAATLTSRQVRCEYLVVRTRDSNRTRRIGTGKVTVGACAERVKQLSIMLPPAIGRDIHNFTN